MFIDLDSFPPLNYEKKIERGPKAPKPRTETEAFRLTSHSLLNKESSPSSPGPGLYLLFCSCHEKDARKRYAQRAEDPLRVCLGRELYVYPIVLNKKKGQCYGPLLFDPILTGDEPRLP